MPSDSEEHKANGSALVTGHLQVLGPEVFPQNTDTSPDACQNLLARSLSINMAPNEVQRDWRGLDFWLPTHHFHQYPHEPVVFLWDLWAVSALKWGCGNISLHCTPLCRAATQHMLGGSTRRLLFWCLALRPLFSNEIRNEEELPHLGLQVLQRKAATGLSFPHNQPLEVRSFLSFLPKGLEEKLFLFGFVIFSRSINSLVCARSNNWA